MKARPSPAPASRARAAHPRAPIGFAHRGARAHAPENTLQAFRLALELGAGGLESDVWLTRDGIAVLDHDGRLPDGRSIGEARRSELPAHVPTLSQLYLECGRAFELSLDVKDPAAASRVAAVARAHGEPSRLWLCHPDWQTLSGWRALDSEIHLVDSTQLRHIPEGISARAERLAACGVSAINLHGREWTAAHVVAVQRAGLRAFAWDLQTPRHLERVLELGVDALYSDHVDRMCHALQGKAGAEARTG
ncbi:MAG: glycerophosphodiester phosphodiesterase [Myxococcota bacterium]